MPFINVSPFHEFLSGMNFILQINVGVVKLTGHSGTGKTALLQELVRDTRQAHQDIVAFYAAPQSFQQVKDIIREQLDLDADSNFHDALLNYLLAKPVEQRRLTVVFDNAGQIDEETLLAIGHLRDIQHGGHNLIGMVLCGRPELTHMLKMPRHQLLATDILLSYELSPLSAQQLPDFCRAVLATRGLENFVLVSDDYSQIMQKSGGLPGKIAELVETYWPDDAEPGDGIGEYVFREQSPDRTSVAQPEPASEETTAVVAPKHFSRRGPREVSFDVTPVLAPDITELSLPSSSGTSPGTLPGVLRATPLPAASAFSPEPADVSTVIAAEISPHVRSGSTDDTGSDVSTEGVSQASDFSTQGAPQASDVSTEAPADILSGISFQGSYAISYEAAADSSSDDLPKAAADVSTAASSALAPEVPSEVLADFSADSAYEGLGESPLDVPPISLSDDSADLSSFVLPDASVGVAPGHPSDSSLIDLPSHASADDSVDDSPTAAAIAPVVMTRSKPTRGHAIASLVLVGVIIGGIAYSLRDTDQREPATQTAAADVNPAAGDRVSSVTVQRFGEPPAASAAPDATPQASTTEAASSTAVIPRPLATAGDTDTTRPVESATAQPLPSEAIALQAPLAVAAPPASPAAVAAITQAVVTAWTGAWQNQDIPAYLAFYHQNFVPPNQAAREAWENSRSRTITSQSSISITVEDFQVLNNSDNQTTVQFLLTYRGDSYADRTVKQLVLGPGTNGELRILKEQNLQTEVFDPVIEAASSWMRDRTPEERAANAAANAESALAQPGRQEMFAPDITTTNAAESDATVIDVIDAEGPALVTDITESIPLIFNLTTLSLEEVQQINGFLMQWAKAWQNQDTDLYLSHYHPDYKTAESASTAAWREDRVSKITAPNRISITLAELEILENNDNNILMELLMEYHTDSYADRTVKRMLLTRTSPGRWLITMENSVTVEKL